MKSINPFTEEVIAEYKELNSEEIEQRLVLAENAFGAWRKTNFVERKEKMLVLARLLREQKREMAEIATREMGKPITQSIAEVEKCAMLCEYYAQNAEYILKEEYITTDASESFVRFDPIGIVLAVMPWNFPYWQVLRFIVPAAMAGNVGVLKHASNVQGCAGAIERIFLEGGFPDGLFQNLSIVSSQVEAVVRDARIKAVTLTGSEYAGRKVAEVAGDEVKHSVLELGGSDPFIVVESIAQEFLKRFKNSFENYIVGDPMDEKTQMGPMVNESSCDEIQKQVQDSIAAGAVLVTGGKRLEGKGFFYAPTILSNVKKGMRAYSEEMFGPLASVIVVQD